MCVNSNVIHQKRVEKKTRFFLSIANEHKIVRNRFVSVKIAKSEVID
jgi:hypothetical protein